MLINMTVGLQGIRQGYRGSTVHAHIEKLIMGESKHHATKPLGGI